MRTIEEMGKNVATAVVLDIYKEITEGIPIDRLAELCQAERENRCSVLPCNVGDTVYCIGSGTTSTMRVGSVFPSGFIVKGKLCNAYLTDDYSYFCATYSDFGKTVFLTQEEAENALKGSADNGV